MQKVIDLRNAEMSDRSGSYGGNAGQKEGIIFDGQNWMVKYPKSSRSLKGKNLPSYVTTPLSEYVGSHIFEILGFDTHETLLAYRRNKIVVLCRDFCENNERLLEMRTLKNMVISEDDYLGESDMSVTGDAVDLTLLLVHLRENPIIMKLSDYSSAERHFWKSAVIDIFIDNNDRNNGNRGLIYNVDKAEYRIAPIYDNGNSFATKADMEKLQAYLDETPEQKIIRATGSRTPYFLNEKQLSAKKFLRLPESGLADAIVKMVPVIKERQAAIEDFIDKIPEDAFGINVCSPIQKAFFKMSLQIRLKHMLVPAYEKVKSKNITSEKDPDYIYKKPGFPRM